MAMSKVLIVEPRDPLIARDGKPFGVGVSASTLPFPFPSTITGGVRTRAGLAGGSFVDSAGVPNKVLIETVKQISTSGALLVELNDQGDIVDWLAPAPADALLLENKADRKQAQVKRLVPIDKEDGVTSIKDPPHASDDLAPVGLPRFDPSKPIDTAPRFWQWAKFEQWLLDPETISSPHNIAELGISGLATEARTHVAIDPGKWTAREGQLFQTRGLEFTQCQEKKIEEAKRLALAIRVDSGEEEPDKLIQAIKEGLSPLGGERRTVMWRESKQSFPSNPFVGDLANTIESQQIKASRVVLLTPAYFTEGSRPTWLLAKRYGTQPQLVGIANTRAQVTSGWDFEHYEKKANGRVVRGRPKKSRRLMPAGSVLFLKFDNGKNIREWIENTWMSCVSDDSTEGDIDQHRRDGFGLAAIGVWDGKLQPMKF
ncbi:MAG TPA: type III-B CRISPR module-associated protein Cmr3 [Pyrinomonadaceae bacterium]|nr:type III-B CRISPR module-associated protein Cmr3 [Pyrinomonadaceae bacterium]